MFIKKILLLGLVASAFFSANAQNTFPATGNVGIGTNNPQVALDVAGSGAFTGGSVLVDGAGYPGSLVIRGTGDSWQISNLCFTSSHTNRFWFFSYRQDVPEALQLYRFDGTTHKPYQTFLTNGNVGIGTSNPQAKLELIGSGGGSIDFRVNGRMQTGDANTAGGVWLNAANTLFVGQVTPTSLGFYNNGDWRLIVNDQGNVGIGTQNPQAKLAVNGDIFSKKVKVTQTGWADYVFEDSYSLPSLNQVEAFIRQHKHLPNVPSAKEVAANGLDLGDNQAILLKKIEELTLYVIEQNKRIEQLEKNIMLTSKIPIKLR